VVRIALTGGPCAGKSSALSHLCRAATEEGFDVLTAPEVATLFFNSGYQFPSPNSPTFEEQKLEFQKQNLELQLGLEKSVNALAASTGRPTIVVFDRGMMDPKAYLSAERWEQAVRELARAGSLPTDKVDDAERFMNDKYDGCIHLVTAADGAPGFYKCGDVQDDNGLVVHRRESAEEACAIDRKLQAVWAGHVRHRIVPNARGFHHKLFCATEAVLEIARAKHPLVCEKQITIAREKSNQRRLVMEQNESEVSRSSSKISLDLALS